MEFFDLFKEGVRLVWNIGQLTADKAKALVLGYFTRVRRWTITLFLAALAPLVIIIPCLLFQVQAGMLYGFYTVYVTILVVAGLLLIMPLFIAVKRAKSLFPGLANDIGEWLDFTRSVLFNGLTGRKRDPLGLRAQLFSCGKVAAQVPSYLKVKAPYASKDG